MTPSVLVLTPSLKAMVLMCEMARLLVLSGLGLWTRPLIGEDLYLLLPGYGRSNGRRSNTDIAFTLGTKMDKIYRLCLLCFDWLPTARIHANVQLARRSGFVTVS